MADPFNRFTTVFSNRLGVPCSALISGSVLTFNGIFKNSNLLRVDNTGMNVVDNVPVLDIPTSVAVQLPADTQITVNNTVYQVREKEAKDDGVFTTVQLAVYTP